MMNMINIKIVIFITVLAGCRSQFKRAKRQWVFESCAQTNLDDCAQRLYLFGYRPVNATSAVRNVDEMKDYCQETREAEKCTKDWAKNCLTSFEKQCLNLLVSGAAQSRRSLCQAKGQQRFLQNRNCFVKTVNTQHDCMDQFKKDMSAVVAGVEKQRFGLKLRSGCCYADKWLKCFRQSAQKVCNDSGIKFLEWVVEPYVADALDLGCRKEWTYGTDSCDKAVKEIPKSAFTATNTSKSIMYPLYSILSEFGKEQNQKDLASFQLPD